MEAFLFAIKQLDRFFKGLFKNFINILSCRCRSWEVLIASFLGKGNRLCRIDFLVFWVAFVSQEKNDCIFGIKSVVLHGCFPLGNVMERLPVLYVENEENHLSVCEKCVADLLVVWTTTKVEEVHSDLVTCDVDLLDTVIHANRSYVFLNESALAIPLDYARLPGFLVANWDQFKKNLVALHFSRFLFILLLSFLYIFLNVY